MLYREEKLLKYLILLTLVACSGMSEGRYRKDFHQGDYTSEKASEEVYALLKQNMTKCYPQSDYPMYEKTVGDFDHAKNSGFVRYEVDNQSMGPRTLVLVDVQPLETGSTIKVFSKGNLTKTGTAFKHDIQKWLDGKKVDCDARGKI
jgi:hypothetical protein